MPASKEIILETGKAHDCPAICNDDCANCMHNPPLEKEWECRKCGAKYRAMATAERCCGNNNPIYHGDNHHYYKWRTDTVEVVEYAHRHYYDGLYQYRYKTYQEAVDALDTTHHRGTCEVVEIRNWQRKPL